MLNNSTDVVCVELNCLFVVDSSHEYGLDLLVAKQLHFVSWIAYFSIQLFHQEIKPFTFWFLIPNELVNRLDALAFVFFEVVVNKAK